MLDRLSLSLPAYPPQCVCVCVCVIFFNSLKSVSNKTEAYERELMKVKYMCFYLVKIIGLIIAKQSLCCSLERL